MAKKQIKKATAMLVPKFEPGQQMASNGNGATVVSDSYGTLWRIDANTGTATEVKFDR